MHYEGCNGSHFNCRWDGALKRWLCKVCLLVRSAKNPTHADHVRYKYAPHWDAFRKSEEFRKVELGIPNVD